MKGSVLLKQLRTPLLLLAAVPVAPALTYVTDASPPWVFLAGAVGVAVLADWVRRSTEQLAAHVGQAVGGLLAISFGSLAEIILAMFVLAHGEAPVVRAQITGSFIGTGLLGLGVAIVAGGVGRERQTFKRERAGLLSSLLILAVIALLLPAVFNLAEAGAGVRRVALTDEQLSIGVSLVLLLLYAANLIFTLVTHRDVFGSGDTHGGGGDEGWPLWLAVAVLVGATAVIALEADLVSGRWRPLPARLACRKSSSASSCWRSSARRRTCSPRRGLPGRTRWGWCSTSASARRSRWRWSSRRCWCSSLGRSAGR
jgi:Ca2+:H+ antiporter